MSTNRIGLVMVVVVLAVPMAAAAQNVTAVRVTRTVAVLEAPQGTAGVVATVNPGEVLEALDERDGWYLVRPAGGGATWRTGWVNGASVQPTSLSPATPPAGGGQAAEPPQRLTAERKGFIIGLGGGVGLHRESASVPRFGNFGQFQGFDDVSNTNVGLATNFRIGYAPTDQVLIYYTNEITLASGVNFDLLGLTGVGVTYLLKTTTPSAFVNGAVGAGTGASVNFDTGSVGSVDRGGAFSIGGGYEFARHWSLEGSAMFVTLNSQRNTVLRGTINWIFY